MAFSMCGTGFAAALARIIHEGTEFSRNTNAPVWYKRLR